MAKLVDSAKEVATDGASMPPTPPDSPIHGHYSDSGAGNFSEITFGTPFCVYNYHFAASLHSLAVVV